MNIMGLISISSFASCKKQLRRCELIAICVLVVWIFMALVDETIYRDTTDDISVSRRLFQYYDNSPKLKVNFTCYNNDDINSKKLFPEKILKERGCEQRFPTILLTGVKYCKTDILTSLLRHHPYLVFPKTADVSYFSDYFDLGISWYRKQMGFTIPEQLTADSSPTYFTNPKAPKRIKSELKNTTKIVVLFCDPALRALREAIDFQQNFYDLSRDMDIQAMKTHERPQEEDVQYNTWLIDSPITANETSSIVQNGIYINFFREWFKHFPPNSIFMLGEQRLLNETEDVLVKLETFLKLPSYFSSKVFRDPVYNYVCIRNAFARFEPYCFSRDLSLSEKPDDHGHKSYSEQINNLRTFYRPYNEKLQRMFLVPVL